MFQRYNTSILSKYTFEEGLKQQPYQIFRILCQFGSNVVQQNPVLRRGKGIMQKDAKNYVLNFLTCIFITKFITVLAHRKKAFALSSPRNFSSMFFKYFFIPSAFATLLTTNHRNLYLKTDFSHQALNEKQLKLQYQSIKQKFLNSKNI